MIGGVLGAFFGARIAARAGDQPPHLEVTLLAAGDQLWLGAMKAMWMTPRRSVSLMFFA